LGVSATIYFTSFFLYSGDIFYFFTGCSCSVYLKTGKTLGSIGLVIILALGSTLLFSACFWSLSIDTLFCV
jgi:hypothetical protein